MYKTSQWSPLRSVGLILSSIKQLLVLMGSSDGTDWFAACLLKTANEASRRWGRPHLQWAAVQLWLQHLNYKSGASAPPLSLHNGDVRQSNGAVTAVVGVSPFVTDGEWKEINGGFKRRSKTGLPGDITFFLWSGKNTKLIHYHKQTKLPESLLSSGWQEDK